MKTGAGAVMLLVLLSGLFWFSANQLPASSSCATDKPARSPAAFTGVVTSTKSHGRVATVRTATGATVTVRGTPATGSVATSVDRTYQIGGRYEFHPINGSSPYEDNACTATRLLSMTDLPPATSDRSTSAKVAALVVLVAGVAAAAIAMIRRRRRRP